MTGSIDNSSTAYDDIYVTEEEVESAIKDLESKKSCGADGIYAEHLNIQTFIEAFKLLLNMFICSWNSSRFHDICHFGNDYQEQSW